MHACNLTPTVSLFLLESAFETINHLLLYDEKKEKLVTLLRFKILSMVLPPCKGSTKRQSPVGSALVLTPNDRASHRARRASWGGASCACPWRHWCRWFYRRWPSRRRETEHKVGWIGTCPRQGASKLLIHKLSSLRSAPFDSLGVKMCHLYHRMDQ